MKQDQTKASTPSSKAVKIRGTVGQDGETFVSDKDSKSWTIENPHAVTGHEGHHVSVRAHVDSDKSSIHITSLKMVPETAEKTTPKKEETKQQ